MGPTQHPVDINSSSPDSPNVIEDPLPSRSYYSSHHTDSNTTEDPGVGRYSASVDSIRAQSLALGEFCMTESDKDASTPTTPSEEEDEGEPAKASTLPPPPPIRRSSPPSNESANSNLSYLFQRYGHHHHKQADQPQQQQQQDEETQPLLGPKKATPRYQATKVDDDRRTSIQTLPDLKAIPSSATEEEESAASSSSSSSSSTPHAQKPSRRHQRGLLGRVDTFWQTHLRPPTWQSIILRPLACIPSVILGLLLNLLDAISYGMITFPLNNPIFASFGPDGISMFFVSCIIAQLVYTCGGSVFDGGNGSMMIEVVPFLHIIAESIVTSIGAEQPEKVISTTMIAFALSSIMTGVAFFLLGALKLGSLIEFFPRHILVATIGGVGWFLVATGIEVSARLDENLVYTWPMFKLLFLDAHVLALWSSALGVALLLRLLQAKLKNHPMVVPIFFMALPVVFYIVVVGIAGQDIHKVRDAGWIFPLVDSDVPFWHFYTYYDFSLVEWKAVAQTLPAMLALTFFGLLHVPINVPALAVSTNKDDVDVNRELVAHGVSNAVSGCFGAVQNYLVYTNSLLFIRSGGDSRLAGIMLALATTVLWMVGPWIVGYIPVMVVGSLIFHLGIDLLKEALVDTWHSVHHLEYITICVIVGCMATLGFVEGIFIGILTACLFFVVQNARRSETIRATFTGQLMRSTVRRMYRQQVFLNQVASQIQVIKLQGYLFFGTINQVERTIRSLLEHRDDGYGATTGDEEQGKGTARQPLHPIRFLVLDLQLVQGLDFSAAEAFVRIRRLLAARQVFMILCNVAPNSDEEKALKKAGVWDDEKTASRHQHHQHQQQGVLKCFEHLDEALEWCENVLLKSYFLKKPHHPIPTPRASPRNADQNKTLHLDTVSTDLNHSTSTSPRHRMLTRAVQHLLQETHDMIKPHANMSQPTLLLAQTFGDLTTPYKPQHPEDEDDASLTAPPPMEFYHTLAHYFEKRTFEAGATIWRQGDPCDFLIVLEQGSLRSLMHGAKDQDDQDVTVETILPGTVVGELGLFAGQSQRRSRSLVVSGSALVVVWQLTRSNFEALVRADPTLATRFVLLTLHFSVERQDTMTKYAFHLHH